MSSVQVAVRTRPFSRREQDSGTPFCIDMKGQSAVIYKGFGGGKSPGTRNNAKEFVFDHSYWSVDARDDHYSDQSKVFSDLGLPVLESAFQGYNACIFAYGQTGSGKTYTMMGSQSAAGLIPRICEGLFSWMAREKLESAEKISFKTEVSYMEIYNEKVGDLLSSSGKPQQHSLRVREHPKTGPYVEDLSKHTVSDYAGISKLIELGNTHRATACTKMNDSSSRSHAIFTVKFTQAKFQCGLPSETVSKLHLVDLAGSERASATGAEGDRLKEGGNINRSLVCLGTVISSLADMSGSSSGRHKKPYIPYRDSVLTWLLKDSLGGNSKTIMIATISPAESSYGETLSTLRYASRAKNIVNKPTVNEDPNVKLIRELRQEIHKLKAVIASGDMDPDDGDRDRLKITRSISLAEDLHKKEEQVAVLTREWAEKWHDIRRIIEEHDLALRSEGVKMVVDSQQPHFVGVDPDILSTGLVFYYVKDGSTSIGSRGSGEPSSISVCGGDISKEHCRVEYNGRKVILHPLTGDCFVNHKRIRKASRLSQGDLLQLGCSVVLRFNHPHEAEKLRRRHSRALLLPKKMASPTEASEPGHVTVSTLAVELNTSSSALTAEQRKSSAVAFTMAKTQSAGQHLDWSRNGNTTSELLLRGTISQDVAEPKQRMSWCCCLLLWLTAPALLTAVGIVTFPALIILLLLLVTMKVFGVSQRFRISRWMGAPMALATTIMVSPLSGLYDASFRIAFGMLSTLRITRPVKRQD